MVSKVLSQIYHTCYGVFSKMLSDKLLMWRSCGYRGVKSIVFNMMLPRYRVNSYHPCDDVDTMTLVNSYHYKDEVVTRVS
jgi:hypothetical protein